jgi:hypothetical protein
MTQYFINAERDRPDYRLVITFLWHDLFNVDTDGDSHNPASRTWTQLYIRNRQDESEEVDVFPVCVTPLILRVESQKDYLAVRTAYFLAEFMRTGIAVSEGGPFLDSKTIRDSLGRGFDVDAAMHRVKSSPFGESTLNDPYPNLRPRKTLSEPSDAPKSPFERRFES